MKQLPDDTAEIAESARKTRRAAAAALTHQIHEARHQLADLVDVEPRRRRRRWPWLVLLLLGITAGAGAAALTRRPQQIEPERLSPREPSSHHSDQDAAQSSQAGNGVVRAGRPSPTTD